ncbi:MAG: hypothetical protein JOZ18_02635 [Chloroflexi bacterium]|nr:hypothetical protein [Chloroflexota bacterium]
MKSQTPEENSKRERKHTVSTLATDQRPKDSDRSGEADKHKNTCEAGTAALSVILGQMVAYFSGRADVDDMDILSFSLHHLFCRADYLYRTGLPQLLSAGALTDNLLCRQDTWSKLGAIQHTIHRMDPLCTLLSDTTRCMLEALDLTSERTISFENTVPRLMAMAKEDEENWLQSLDQGHWGEALTTLMGCLNYWQQSYNGLAFFARHFAGIVPAEPLATRLDEVFHNILDSAAAVFGEILPGFQAISTGDAAAVATLLFDLMQQADLLLVQFDTALEPLHTLIEHFALTPNK